MKKNETRAKTVDGGGGYVPAICGACLYLYRGFSNIDGHELPECGINVWFPYKTGNCKRFKNIEEGYK